MLRKDFTEGGEQRYYTYFKEPGDVRRMTFMVWKDPDANDDRWIYIPSIDLIKRIAANDKNSSFVGSDFTYEDVSGRHWSEDQHSLVREDTIDGKAVYVIKSVPREKESAAYEHRISYIDKESFLPLKEEYMDKDGNVKRIFKAEEIKEIEGILTVTRRSMTDVEKGNSTVVAFNDIDYNVGLEENIFSERYLREAPRQYIAQR
jgi:outer membrane lipoprotein-sorting protein